MKKLLCALAATISFAANAGPFGLEMGSTLEQLSQSAALTKEKIEFVWSTPKLPNGMPEFDDYRLVVTPKQGLCKISAFIDNVPTNRFGDGAKRAFEKYEKLLERKYGKGKRLDFVRKGSIWTEPADWTMGLHQKERTLATYWTDSNGYVDNIKNIVVSVSGINSETAMLRVAYEFKNIDACSAFQDAQEKSTL